MKILVIQQKKIGDVLTSTILFEALRKEYPKAELHYLVNSHTLPVLENNPFIDKTVDFTTELQNDKQKFYAFLNTLKAKNYAIVIDVYVKISSGLITYFTKAKTRIAYHKSYSSFLYSATIKRLNKPEQNHSLAIENRLKLLEPLDITATPITPKLYLKKEEIDSAKTELLNSSINLQKPLVMVNILGSIPKKTYPIAYMVELLDFCAEQFPEIQFLFNYIPSQKEKAKSIFTRTKANTQKQIFFELFGENLREFMAITAHCSASIGNEGGGANMAKALNVSTFTIFSPVIEKIKWFGAKEKPKHQAIHCSDLFELSKRARKHALKHPEIYYKKMTPQLIKPQLEEFLNKL